MVPGTGSRPYSFDAILFEPSIRHLIAEARPHPGESVLDVACGSGIAACKAGAIVGATGRVCGVDVGPNILKKAVSLYTGTAPAHWVRGNAQKLPFADASFRVVLCHQGLQFVPDRVACVAELRRVAMPAGRVAVMTWTHIADCPFYLALHRIVGKLLGPEAADFVAAPFSLPDEDDLRVLLGTAFRRVSISRISVRTVHPSAGAFAAAFMEYIPAAMLPERNLSYLKGAVIAEMDERMAPWQVDGPMIAPIVAHVAMCR